MKRVVNLGTVETLGSDAYMTPRERRLAGLPREAKTYDEMRDKKRARRRMKE